MCKCILPSVEILSEGTNDFLSKRTMVYTSRYFKKSKKIPLNSCNCWAEFSRLRRFFTCTDLLSFFAPRQTFSMCRLFIRFSVCSHFLDYYAKTFHKLRSSFLSLPQNVFVRRHIFKSDFGTDSIF